MTPPSTNPGARRFTPWVILTTVLLVLVLAYYYAAAAKYLPRGAGPDSAAHHDVARFIFDNGRLAVIPEDEPQLLFTPYGTTRALRPPLSYIVSAAVAAVIHSPERDLFKELRVGSGLLCALAAGAAFVALWLLFAKFWLALAGALLFGLLPQLAFIGAYTNDDSGAIFSATCLVLALVVIHIYGLNVRTAGLFGFSAGLVILSKFTAWLLLPAAMIFLLPIMWRRRDKLALLVPVALAAFIVGGGWWIVFNTSQYGIDDPLLFAVSEQVSEAHARLPNPGNRGFASHGIGWYQLMIDNYKNFIGESFKSTIGNLDWLRLRLGWPQYGLYLLVVALALIYVPLKTLAGHSGRYGIFTRQPQRQLFLYWILLLIIVFQVYMYVSFNLYHDIQIQGKYMLPVLLPVLILFSAAVLDSGKIVTNVIAYLNIDRLEGKTITAILLLLSFAIIVGSHLHAVTTYIEPYYYPAAYKYKLKPFRSVDLRAAGLVRTSTRVVVQTDASGIRIRSAGDDPQLLLNPSVCKLLAVNSLMQVEIDAVNNGTFKVYIDDGGGFSEDNSVGAKYTPGSNRLLMAIGIEKCVRMRIDPMADSGSVTITRIAFAPIQVSTP